VHEGGAEQVSEARSQAMSAADDIEELTREGVHLTA
jgi:hypothetical protein